jgi:hypothetical protein
MSPVPKISPQSCSTARSSESYAIPNQSFFQTSEVQLFGAAFPTTSHGQQPEFVETCIDQGVPGNVVLLQGRPGSGKSSTIGYLILIVMLFGLKVVATGQSNAAAGPLRKSDSASLPHIDNISGPLAWRAPSEEEAPYQLAVVDNTTAFSHLLRGTNHQQRAYSILDLCCEEHILVHAIFMVRKLSDISDLGWSDVEGLIMSDEK